MQNKFIEWCEEKRFQDVATVTASKIHWFMEERVLNRERKNKQKSDKNSSNNIIGIDTAKQYVNALISLYSHQVAMNMNSNPHPRTETVSMLLKNYASDNVKRKRTNFDDRGAGTLLDGYTSLETLVQIVNVFWEQNSGNAIKR
jgi:hypothetical protein